MPLISIKNRTDKDKIKLAISKEIHTEIKDYCNWIGLNDLSYFFEEAALFVFSKDKDWKQQKRKVKSANDEPLV